MGRRGNHLIGRQARGGSTATGSGSVSWDGDRRCERRRERDDVRGHAGPGQQLAGGGASPSNWRREEWWMDRDLGATGGTVERCSETDQAGVGGEKNRFGGGWRPWKKTARGNWGAREPSAGGGGEGGRLARVWIGLFHTQGTQ